MVPTHRHAGILVPLHVVIHVVRLVHIVLIHSLVVKLALYLVPIRLIQNHVLMELIQLIVVRHVVLLAHIQPIPNHVHMDLIQ